MSFAQYHLNYLALGFAGLSTDNDLREIIHNEVAKEFDGDYNVLIDSLIIVCDQNNYDLETMMNSVFDENGLSTIRFLDLLEAFEDIDECNYYPQIFIPEFEIHEDNYSYQVLTVAYNGNEELDTFYSYNNSSGYLVEQTVVLNNEDQADDYEIWVISINEDVDCDGLLESESTPNGNNEKVGSSCTCQGTESQISFEIEKMTVKTLHEGWLGGKSDIAIKSTRSYWNFKDPATGEFIEFISLGFGDFRGYKLAKIKRKDVKDQNEKTISVQIIDDWNVECYYEHPILMGYVIFERDNWPVNTRTKDLPILNVSPADEIFLTFRSAADQYYKGWFYGNDCESSTSQYYPDGLVIDNSDIKYNTKLN